ncbi:MAG: 16S rRNA (guanine(527)-N(7))-methyltransferase RsmG, partial [Methylocystaceae bacterium]|nr:16S rRNA (guanine(527)-N(7))-methyltransferase RsmG [Methylocystaceae bacterium]
MNTLEDRLTTGLQQLELTVSIEKYLLYLQLLHKWNQAYNLTAIRDPEAMVSRHILDSLTCLPYLKGSHIIDIGTGAGLPGIPLAIACPERQFVL